jgi:hypothetical protein
VLRSLGRLLALGKEDRVLLVDAYMRLIGVECALRLRGGRALAPSAHTGLGVATADAVVAGERYAAWLDVAARHHFVRARCLHRSMALYGWLRSRGLPCELRIGVHKTDGGLAAHAWVEVSGHAVAEPLTELDKFVPLHAAQRILNRP